MQRVHLRKEVVIGVIILLALLIRITHLPYGKYENETARDIAAAKSMIDEEKFRLVGITGEGSETSQQQSFGPAYYYLIGILLLVWRHPYAAVLATIMLSMVTIIISYVLAKKYFSREITIIATALFAFNPWFGIFVSLNTMTPSYLLPFTLLFVYAIYKILVEEKEKFVLLAGFAAALMLQIHLSSLIMLLGGGLLVLIKRPKIIFSKQVVIGLGIAFILLLPFIIFNLQEGTTVNIFKFLGNRYEVSRWENLRDAVAIPLMLGTTYFGKYLLGSEHMFSRGMEYLFMAIDGILVIGILAGLAIAIKKWRTKTQSKEESLKYFILIAWFLFPIAFAIISGTNIAPHYMLITYPTQFIFLALTIKKIEVNWKINAKITTVAAVLIFLIFTGSFFSLLKENGGTDGIYGIPLKEKMKVMEYLEEQNTKEVYTYKYVKQDYSLLAEMRYPTITVKALSDLNEKPKGILLLDLYSRGNFAEKTLTKEEQEMLEALPSVKKGKIILIEMEST